MNANPQLPDIVWMLSCAALVMLMQAGFCCLESGLARGKNSINVAIKNLSDFCIASGLYWLFGFGLMFGASWHGLIGTSNFALEKPAGPWLLAFFLFQLVFCGTATTIISGAVAERIRFVGYLAISVLVSALFYPIFGHWAWGGAGTDTPTGWLAKIGFIDFAGSSVVHSLGGWLSLAAVLVVGPRLGRFDEGRPMRGSDLPLATLGVFLLWFGWFGFNGGSTLAVNGEIPLILVNTNLGAALGGIAGLGLSYAVLRRPDVALAMNGVLGGLVAITASCHLVAPGEAMLIGFAGGAISVLGTWLLERWRVDDVVGAVPVHGFCGVWGTLAVALFAETSAFTHGGGRPYQLAVQLLGAAACFAWAFGGGYVVFRLLNFVLPLRTDARSERIGLNIAEHDAGTELVDLLTEMDTQRERADFSHRVAVEPHTEVGQIALAYNHVLGKVEREITTREAAVESARKAEEKYRSIFENAIEGIFQTSPDGRYLDANPALARIYGYDSPEQLRAGVLDIERQLYVDPQRRGEFVRLMAEQGAIHGFESQIYRRDGSAIWISENVRSVRDAAGRLLYYEGTVEDINERKSADALRSDKEAAEAASQAKSAFLANMSHEIRTPLNGVVGMLELLAASELTDRQRHFVRIGKGSAESLLAVINQILDFSKIEAGKLELESLDFDPRLLAEDTIEMFARTAEQRKLELACQISLEVPAVVRGDQDRLRQVLINLINNALKFTERGEVIVQVTRVRETKGEVVLRLAVRDTGPGISQSQQGRLFQSFSQLDASTTRLHGGTGLGLAISKGLVELMRGRIGVDSRLGAGSTFWCEIPFQKQTTRITPRQVPDALRRLRVVAVDDNHTNLEILREQFQGWGLRLTTISESPRALAILRDAAAEGCPFELVILDAQMPALDGFQLARAIKENPATRDAVLIMLTSMGQEFDAAEMRELGLAGYIHKPVRQSRLLDTIVEATSSTVLVEMPTPRAEFTMAPLRRGRVLVAEDNDINQIVVAEILGQAGYECEIVANGRAAAEGALSGRFDVVLMDCQMPLMDGFEAARLIRHSEEQLATSGHARHVPIIALTANAVKGDRQRCLAAGMDSYLTKPVDPAALVAAVEQTIACHGNAPAASTADELGPPDVCAIDLAALEERCLGNMALVARVLDKFNVAAAEQRASIQRALSAGDAAAVAATAHLLKGMALNVAAADVATVATEIETAAERGELGEAARLDARLHDAIERACEACRSAIDRLAGAAS